MFLLESLENLYVARPLLLLCLNYSALLFSISISISYQFQFQSASFRFGSIIFYLELVVCSVVTHLPASLYINANYF